MKTPIKVFLFIGIGLVILGLVVAAAGFAAAKGDFANLFPAVAQTEKSEDFEGEGLLDLVVDGDYHNIVIEASKDNDIHVTYYEAEDGDYTLAVENDTLTIKKTHQPWWKSIGIFYYTPKTMTIAIPATLETVSATADASSLSIADVTLKGTLTVNADAGNTEIANVTVGDVTISADAGRVNLNGVNAKNIAVDASAGNVKWEDVTCGDVDVESDAGRVEFTDVSCDHLEIASDAGAVILDSVKMIAAKISTDAGKIEFTALAVAESLELSTDFGAIRGTIDDAMTAFTITSSVDMGDSNLPTSYRGGDKILTAEADSGDIEIEFLR